MARFKGKSAARPDPIVPVIVAAILLIALVFLIWFLVDQHGFSAYWNTVTASFHH
jgi:hypothetical protein